MNKDRLISQLAGRWIVQTTNYSLLKNFESRALLCNQVHWTHVHEHEPYLSKIKKYGSSNSVDMYCIKSRNSNEMDIISYIILLYQGPELSSIIKLDQNFALLNQFLVQDQSEDQLTIVSLEGSVSIVEKICFLNCNLKVIKSTIQRFNKCIGASFSSEIRIS